METDAKVELMATTAAQLRMSGRADDSLALLDARRSQHATMTAKPSISSSTTASIGTGSVVGAAILETLRRITAASTAKTAVRVVNAARAARKSHPLGNGNVSAATSAYV
ncbi:hypothetical protein NKR19_g5317 [Coniochaeta hoffmannii]|uniref:Uncharacterized protein n=1 Tax=Coniochaeta hoffmannii TaxID=91930 RepID=A0AA38S4I7_9PEZI|nr:hypothetical protein NKR19_g5317 [Coniochaeta hoffmannii]